MKKKLEADLISIAHRILKLANKSELIQLHQETQKLSEKLSVLRFVEENFGDIKPTIGLQEIEEKIEEIFAAEEKEVSVVKKEKAVNEESKKEVKEPITIKKRTKEEPKKEISELIKTVGDKSKEKESETIFFKPDFELTAPDEEQESKKLTLEDVLESVQPLPVFVKAEEAASMKEPKKEITSKDEVGKSRSLEITFEKPEEKEETLNDRLKRAISFGLNDRIAFEKQLFGNSSEDLNRVVSQLNTFDNYHDAKDFIENLVKPDYNNWEGKEEYEDRFMKLIESKFI